MAATLTAVRREGLEGARIEGIARAAGVTRAAFYFHFATKDEVLEFVLRESEARVAATIRALPPGADLADAVSTTAEAIAREWQDEPALLAAVGTVALRATASAIPGAGDHPARDALRERFERGAEGFATGLPAALLADFLLVNLFAAATAWTAQPHVPLRDVLGAVGAFFLRGAGAARN